TYSGSLRHTDHSISLVIVPFLGRKSSLLQFYVPDDNFTNRNGGVFRSHGFRKTRLANRFWRTCRGKTRPPRSPDGGRFEAGKLLLPPRVDGSRMNPLPSHFSDPPPAQNVACDIVWHT